eukprot:TRINITY_DN14758_c0_g1_i1.p1 TRINITY_DN14758_c0_g1~~TRINITY_DN14758_c0_g1_i1.p1  ORF type:complete len:372 (+),score=27.12 TRINITY_DN14758_c0_g1_i1:69-1118(+)
MAGGGGLLAPACSSSSSDRQHARRGDAHQGVRHCGHLVLPAGLHTLHRGRRGGLKWNSSSETLKVECCATVRFDLKEADAQESGRTSARADPRSTCPRQCRARALAASSSAEGAADGGPRPRVHATWVLSGAAQRQPWGQREDHHNRHGQPCAVYDNAEETVATLRGEGERDRQRRPGEPEHPRPPRPRVGGGDRGTAAAGAATVDDNEDLQDETRLTEAAMLQVQKATRELEQEHRRTRSIMEEERTMRLDAESERAELLRRLRETELRLQLAEAAARPADRSTVSPHSPPAPSRAVRATTPSSQCSLPRRRTRLGRGAAGRCSGQPSAASTFLDGRGGRGLPAALRP